ncbi:MarR family transcriptional regulator [Microbacterium sp. STN6]|uniref:MarR family winged helix-turn-helix transcriptional regulator n=1 Tax=Microbacterium sp. STN6 TaxID=2995588 RepID=UPI002260B002|nr:MarR family transcriptional regulator [Microbacterium sp. STN6]MCX7520789.1 MarR family transcriptional regulator [Microbacterium sp. STN6]
MPTQEILTSARPDADTASSNTATSQTAVSNSAHSNTAHSNTAHSADGASGLQRTLSDLVQTSHRLTRLAAHVSGNTESPATWRTISVLQSFGAMRLGELATRSRVSQPTMTKLVRNLVEREWVKRIADTDDARAWQIASTRKGEAALQQWRDTIATALVPLFEDITDDEAEVLRRAVDIISSRERLTDAASAALLDGAAR